MGHNTTSLALQHTAYDEEPEPQPRNLPLHVSPHTIKSAKDPAQFSRRNPDPLIRNLNLNPALSQSFDTNRDTDRLIGVLDGILDQVAEHQPQFGAIT
jgi:hypothetical protein